MEKTLILTGGKLTRVLVTKNPCQPQNEKLLEAVAASKLTQTAIDSLCETISQLERQLKRANYLVEIREKERDQVKLAHRRKLQQVDALRHRIDMLKQDIEISNDKLREAGIEVDEDEEVETDEEESSIAALAGHPSGIGHTLNGPRAVAARPAPSK